MTDGLINWEEGTNISKDAVQYWGKCQGCDAFTFVDVHSHRCSRCTLSGRPETELVEVVRLEVIESKPIEKTEESKPGIPPEVPPIPSPIPRPTPSVKTEEPEFREFIKMVYGEDSRGQEKAP
jgi:hypothetical protein